MADPRLSIVVAFHDMGREAPRTLDTLDPGYQRGVAADAYEVIAVDVGSEPPLEEALVRSHGPTFRLVRSPRALSPVAAINAAVRTSRAGHCGLDLIDRWLREVHGRLLPDGLFVATFFPGPQDSVVRGWTYPANLRYRPSTLAALATDVGFEFRLLDWAHPAQQWVLLSKGGQDLAWIDNAATLSWNVMAERFQVRRGTTAASSPPPA